jgi:hypothetical protein
MDTAYRYLTPPYMMDDNALLEEYKGDCQTLKLADFGLAKRSQSWTTSADLLECAQSYYLETTRMMLYCSTVQAVRTASVRVFLL